MGPSEKTFNQVKNILGKLERSIDQLSHARTNPPPPPQIVPEQRVAPVQPAQPVPVRPASQYGRATPLRPN